MTQAWPVRASQPPGPSDCLRGRLKSQRQPPRLDLGLPGTVGRESLPSCSCWEAGRGNPGPFQTAFVTAWGEPAGNEAREGEKRASERERILDRSACHKPNLSFWTLFSRSHAGPAMRQKHVPFISAELTCSGHVVRALALQALQRPPVWRAGFPAVLQSLLPTSTGRVAPC